MPSSSLFPLCCSLYLILFILGFQLILFSLVEFFFWILSNWICQQPGPEISYPVIFIVKGLVCMCLGSCYALLLLSQLIDLGKAQHGNHRPLDKLLSLLHQIAEVDGPFMSVLMLGDSSMQGERSALDTAWHGRVSCSGTLGNVIERECSLEGQRIKVVLQIMSFTNLKDKSHCLPKVRTV